MTGMGNGTMEGKRNSIGNIKEGERAREKTEKEKKKIYIYIYIYIDTTEKVK